MMSRDSSDWLINFTLSTSLVDPRNASNSAESGRASAAALVTSSNDEDPNEWLTVIKRMKPSSENITSIKTAMEKTFIHHRNWISMESPTVGDICQQYPRFIEMPSLVRLLFEFYQL